MTLKKATITAFVGMILELIAGIFYLFVSLDVIKYSESLLSIYKVFSFIHVLATISLCIFFYTLYLNQKK
ncbi:hypothetical protein Y919_09760 [Caloranaerobacter azorensis H53214]|uniref:Uncharacterized protein n=1 Tax=Caloranaerobacter azorensis H53214 TaxID=1156417 RepID=A0A096CTD7_9FIRM|nr:hypothetical protein [Caloranaerobacter azorensis]KGG79824.1 hypothetical protein Y919_09760 [Caloranaerobacter azorensis H53214]